MERIKLAPNINGKTFLTNFGVSHNDVVVAHIFSTEDEYITSVQVDPSDWYVSNTLADGGEPESAAAATLIDLEAMMTKAGYSSGQFRVDFHFLRNHILQISADEVSEDFKEIKISGETVIEGAQPQAAYFAMLWNQIYSLHSPDNDEVFTLPLVIDEGESNISHVINMYADLDPNMEESALARRLYLKLLSPLKLEGKGTFNISTLCADIISTRVTLRTPERAEPFRLLHPNFDISIDIKGSGTTSPKKTWDEILGSGTVSSQQLISKFVSSSYGEGMELNIDYRDFKNFIHFSSAEERLRNFHYKMTLLESYRDDIADLNALSGAEEDAAANIINKQKSIDSILNGFDPYERYMYYESGSSGRGNTLYESATWPKYNNTKPYCNMSSSTSAVKAWFGNPNADQPFFGGQIYSASLYDRLNDDMLLKALPQFIIQDSQNHQIFTYCHMLGQHYDILFNYVRDMTTIHSREEDPAAGSPKEMLFSIAQSMGLQLFNGNVNEDLWEYALGTNEAGGTLQTGLGSTSGSLTTYSGKDRTQEIWNRLINNLPMLLKTKGTERSVRALINCYGIPSSILRIIEFGGPDLEGQTSHMAVNRYSNALQFGRPNGLNYLHGNSNTYNNRTGYWNTAKRPIKTMEMRINSTYKQNQALWTANDGRRALLLEHSSSGHGTHRPGTSPYARLKWHVSASAADAATGGFISCSTDWAPILDGDWWNVMVQFPDVSGSAVSDWPGQEQQFHIYAKKSAEFSGGRITHAVSASTEIISGSTEDGATDGAWRQYTGPTGQGNDLIGGRGQNWTAAHIPADLADDWGTSAHFSGSMQEYRIWTSVLSEQAFNQHIQNPNCIVGNNYSSSYYDIVTRFRMGTDLLTTTLSGSTAGAVSFLTSSHPQYNIDFGSTTAGYDARYMSASVGSVGGTYADVEETYYIDMPSTVGSRPLSNKIRIEDNKLDSHMGQSGELHSHLSRNVRREKSAMDTAPMDTNKLGIYMSPTNDINMDIANTIGQTRLDQFVGDPRDYYKLRYTEMEDVRKEYFQKYSGAKGMWDYIRQIEFFDGSLFKIINKFIPNKANELSGLLIEPSMLERNKIARKGKPILTEDLFPNPVTIKIDGISTSSADMFKTSSFRKVSGESIMTSGSLYNYKVYDLYNNTHIYDFSASNDMKVGAGSDGQPWEMAVYGSSSIHTLHGYNMRTRGSRYPQQHLVVHQGTGGYTQGSMSFQPTPVMLRDALNPCITGSKKSQLYKKINYFYSSSVSMSRHMEYLNSGGWRGPYEYSRDINTPIWMPSAKGMLQNGQYGNIYGSYKKQAYSSSLEYAETNIDDNMGCQKMAFSGCQLQGPDFNVPTSATPDGGAVIEFFETNPNLLFSADEATGATGEILLSGELPLLTPSKGIGGNKGDIIPGSQQPGPQGQTNGYWFNTGYEMQWITASPPNTSWAGKGKSKGGLKNDGLKK